MWIFCMWIRVKNRTVRSAARRSQKCAANRPQKRRDERHPVPSLYNAANTGDKCPKTVFGKPPHEAVVMYAREISRTSQKTSMPILILLPKYITARETTAPKEQTSRTTNWTYLTALYSIPLSIWGTNHISRIMYGGWCLVWRVGW